MSDPNTTQNLEPVDNKKRNRLMIGIFVILASIGAAWFVYWFSYGRFHKYTNDAYVAGNTVMITAQVPGIVTTIFVQDADFVQKGTPLVQIDPTDHQIYLDLLLDELGRTVREIGQLFANVQIVRADILANTALLLKKTEDFERRKALVPSLSVSLEDFSHAKYDMESQEAVVLSLEKKLLGLLSQTENTTIQTHPKVLAAKQQVLQAYINLKRCTLYAPVSGVVAQRTVQVGKWVQVPQPLLSVVPLDQMWIEANFKETQLSDMRVGQPVKIRSDMYGYGVEYRGVVAGVGGGTGSAFSVLPAQNATGNWIKIVQRVPVRIELPSEMLQDFPLRVGLSMEVTVDTSQNKGSMTPQARVFYDPRFSTDIYADEEAGGYELIEKTIQANLPPFTKELEQNDS